MNDKELERRLRDAVQAMSYDFRELARRDKENSTSDNAVKSGGENGRAVA